MATELRNRTDVAAVVTQRTEIESALNTSIQDLGKLTTEIESLYTKVTALRDGARKRDFTGMSVLADDITVRIAVVKAMWEGLPWSKA